MASINLYSSDEFPANKRLNVLTHSSEGELKPPSQHYKNSSESESSSSSENGSKKTKIVKKVDVDHPEYLKSSHFGLPKWVRNVFIVALVVGVVLAAATIAVYTGKISFLASLNPAHLELIKVIGISSSSSLGGISTITLLTNHLYKRHKEIKELNEKTRHPFNNNDHDVSDSNSDSSISSDSDSSKSKKRKAVNKNYSTGEDVVTNSEDEKALSSNPDEKFERISSKTDGSQSTASSSSSSVDIIPKEQQQAQVQKSKSKKVPEKKVVPKGNNMKDIDLTKGGNLGDYVSDGSNDKDS